MANSAFDHSPSITVPGSSTNTALVRWSGTGGTTFLDSTIIVGATTMGLAADTDLLTFGNGTIAITGAITGVTTITAVTFHGSGANLTGISAGGASVIQMNDSVNIALGTGSDSILYYDGTDTIWRTMAAGSGNRQLRFQRTDGSQAYFETYGSQGPDVYLYHSKGSIGAHTVVASGERHGRIRFGASDGTAFHVGADIIGVANQNWLPAGDNDRGTRLEIYTTADDAADPTLAMTIENNGDLNLHDNNITNSPGVCKAYCHISAAGVLRSGSFNVASTSKVSTGFYRATWDKDFADTNYTVAVTCKDVHHITVLTGTLVGQADIEQRHNTGNAVADGQSEFMAFGDQ